MAVALLLVDLQQDYLERGGLAPAPALLRQRVAHLLAGCRNAGIPVIHVHTRISPGGEDRMPHLRHSDIWWCVEGSPGAMPPPEAAPLPGEAISYKNVFNAFANPGLDAQLQQLGIDTLIIAGIHLHACVRETALAAYQSGYRVYIANDAVASYDVLHAEITREYLSSRGISFLSSAQILKLSTAPATALAPADAAAATSAWIGGEWLSGDDHARWECRNPSHWDELLGVVAEASTAQIEQAVALAAAAQRQWATQNPQQRGAYLARFADALASRHEALAQAMAQEVGKPLRDARAEAARAVELVRLAVEDFCTAPQWQQCAEGVHARRVPVGVVAAITPFNHPLAIPLGKMAPALALGNAVVWKPALPAHRTTQLVIEAVVKAGMPDHLIAVVLGDGNTAQRLVRHPQVAAVSVTASTAAGRQLAMTCATALKPLQAELGGNNAVVIMGDVDISRIADDLARAAFSFAGQRCTAGRRILVERGRHRELLEAVAAAAAALQVGRPEDLSTDVGPLISRQQQAAVAAAVAHAAHNGGRIICGGHVPAGFEEGCWYAPTLVDGVSADSPLFTQESFAPIAVVHPFCGFDEAIQLANGVPHGLVATFYGDDVHLQQRFLAEVQAGVVKLNCTPSGVHAAAPFGGWKESGFGPPEHGKWDEELYTRAQALYGFGAYRPSSC